MWWVLLALVIDAPFAPLITPFGWVVLVGAASAIMAVQLIGGWLRMRGIVRW